MRGARTGRCSSSAACSTTSARAVGGDHSHRGRERARSAASSASASRRSARERVLFLVRHHLLMSHVAQRRDLSDPKVIVEFARVVGDRENLRNLYLPPSPTSAPPRRRAGPSGRAQLLRELYERTAEFLETGEDDPERALRADRASACERRQGAARGGARGARRRPRQIDALLRRHAAALLRRRTRRARSRATRSSCWASMRAASASTTAVREMRGGFSEFILCARDVHGLYADVAGALAAAGINILGSNVYTTKQGLALEVYRVTTPPGGEEERRERLGGLAPDPRAGARRRAGRRGRADRAAAAARRPRAARRRASRRRRGLATTSRTSTRSIDVTADDRLGLLHDLDAHDRRPRARDLHVEGDDDPRPGRPTPST